MTNDIEVEPFERFLMERIDERESAIRSAAGFCQSVGDYKTARLLTALLAECVGQRAIVEEHRPVPCENVRHPGGLHCRICEYDEIQRGWYPCATLRHLGTAFTTHPHYREKWRP